MSKSRPDVSKMTHGVFITINSMILNFKHIIHIDDFPLNGHPPSRPLRGSSSTTQANGSEFNGTHHHTSFSMLECVCMCMRACVRACVCVCVRALIYMNMCVH